MAKENKTRMPGEGSRAALRGMEIRHLHYKRKDSTENSPHPRGRRVGRTG